MTSSGSTMPDVRPAGSAGGPEAGKTVAALTSEAPERRWELSVPESGGLLRGTKLDDRTALKLALKELVAREKLTLVFVTERRRFGPPKPTAVLTDGPRIDRPVDRPLGRSLLAVLAVYENALPPAQQPDAVRRFFDEVSTRIRSNADGDRSPRDVVAAIREAYRGEMAVARRAQARAYGDGTVGVLVRDLAQAVFLRDRWDDGNSPWLGYARAVVLRDLEARGLYAPERYRRLGLFGATRWVLTPAGAAAKSGLEASLAIGGLARGRRRARRLEDELRLLAGPLGSAADIDAAFAAIDRGVNKGWNAVQGD